MLSEQDISQLKRLTTLTETELEKLIRSPFPGVLQDNFSIVLFRKELSAEYGLYCANNTDVIGLPSFSYRDYQKLFHPTYKPIDIAYCCSAIEMFESGSYPRLDRAVLDIAGPIKTRQGAKWVSRQFNMAMLDSTLQEKIIYIRYAVIGDYHGTLTPVKGRFLHSDASVRNKEKFFERETEVLQYRAAIALRNYYNKHHKLDNAKQEEVWRWRARGIERKQIAYKTGLSYHTVGQYLSNLRELGLTLTGRRTDEIEILNFLRSIGVLIENKNTDS